MKTYKYYLPDHGETADDARESAVDSFFSENMKGFMDWVAEKCAKDEFGLCDLESTSPFKLMLLDADGKEIGLFEIKLKYEPVFTSRRLDASPQEAEG